MDKLIKTINAEIDNIGFRGHREWTVEVKQISEYIVEVTATGKSPKWSLLYIRETDLEVLSDIVIQKLGREYSRRDITSHLEDGSLVDEFIRNPLGRSFEYNEKKHFDMIFTTKVMFVKDIH